MRTTNNVYCSISLLLIQKQQQQMSKIIRILVGRGVSAGKLHTFVFKIYTLHVISVICVGYLPYSQMSSVAILYIVYSHMWELYRLVGIRIFCLLFTLSRRSE